MAGSPGGFSFRSVFIESLLDYQRERDGLRRCKIGFIVRFSLGLAKNTGGLFYGILDRGVDRCDTDIKQKKAAKRQDCLWSVFINRHAGGKVMGRTNMAVVSKGFTLLELLVVISIIGILMAIGSVSFSTAQKKGRDSRRQGDMQAIQKSLEECYALDNKYPPTSGVVSGSALSCAVSTASVMNQVPFDPKNIAGSYVYTYTVDAADPATIYCLCAQLENIGTGNASTVGASGVCNWTGTPKNYFCVSNQQ